VGESGSSEDLIRVASGLAYVCRHLDELREVLGDDGSDPSMPLTRLVVALRGNENPSLSRAGGQPTEQPTAADVARLLTEVHAAVQAAGDALGVYGIGRSRDGGASGLEVLLVVFRCPLQRCAGRPAHEVTESQPRCSVSSARLPMIRERL
jgi:hypothetical protein